MRINLPPLHKGQAIVRASTARFKVLACGRRWGKTTYSLLEAIFVALLGGYVWWIAPTFSLTNTGFKAIMEIALQIPGVQIIKGERKIYFPGGGWIQAMSAHNPDSLRSVSLDLAVLDEAAYMSDDAWQAIRPTLTDRAGRAILISTPRGRNWFWRMWMKGIDPLEAEWESWKLPTWTNLTIPNIRAEVFSARRDMIPVKFLQEYVAEFIGDFGAAFSGLDKVNKMYPLETPENGREYYFGIDWGRHVDFTVITVMDDLRRVVYMDRFTQRNFSRQRETIKLLSEVWNPSLIVGELNGMGEGNVEALEAEGLPIKGFNMTNASKTRIVDSLAVDIERNTITLLDDAVALGELAGFETKQTPSGLWQYTAPEGMHDDTVISLALANFAVNEGAYTELLIA